MDHQEVLQQSQNAIRQWKDLWTRNCQINKNLATGPISLLKNQGIGKNVVCISMGPSLEKQIDDLKKYRDKVDIICVDKAAKALIQRGIIPDFVVIADAQVSYEIYCEPIKAATRNITLIGNINSNPKWGMNWLGQKFYYINKDNINSEVIFSGLTGITDLMIAGSNVSNAALIFASTYMIYDAYFLCGFDFSWPVNGNFYAFEKRHEKNAYLNQIKTYDRDFKLVCTSNNLWFSCRWLKGFIEHMVSPSKRVVNCSDGILQIQKCNPNLGQELQKIGAYQRKLRAEELTAKAEKNFQIRSGQDFERAKNMMSDENVIVTNMAMNYFLKEEEKYGNPIESRAK